MKQGRRYSEDQQTGQAAHARKQLAAQGLKLPTQSWKTGKISNPVV
jgi:hypothetical protein